VPSAHIDGSDIWINGEWYTANKENRDLLKQVSESGEVKIVWNRYVMREGIDWTHLYHGILATVFGSLTAYLQSVGRLLRAHKGMDHVIIQDHGGNWWRHGSANQDRHWDLKLTTRIAVQLRERAMREKREPEPIRCPRCTGLRLWGRECPHCGYCHRTRPRMVIETDGSLKEVDEAIHKPRRVSRKPHHVKNWERTVWRCKNAGKTFAQAEALFAKEHNWCWPDRSWPLMPTRELDWFRRVGDVPTSLLTGNPNAN
jgi:ferredoxin